MGARELAEVWGRYRCGGAGPHLVAGVALPEGGSNGGPVLPGPDGERG